jgi:methyl-accepting chemotaxis protein
MDQVTQQNAAMVEQSTAASHSLAQETSQLSDLVAQFQVGNSAPRTRHQHQERANVFPMSKSSGKPGGHAARPVAGKSHGRGPSAVARKQQPEAEADTWSDF